jgi:serine/threonine-protein kinase
MKSLFRYIILFFATFCIAGAAAYYSVRLYTRSAKEIVLPELTGKNIIYVLETLTNLGLNARLRDTQYHDSVPRYSVISQSPAPGTTIKKGRDVVIYLSKGKKESIIPDLRLIGLEKAKILLEKNEFRVGHISQTYSDSLQKGRVIAQNPAPFSTTFKGSECNLLISRGHSPEGYVMPDLHGMPLETAASAIETRHLHISNIISSIEAGKDPGIVLSQTPERGSYVTAQTSILLTVNGSKKNQTMSPDMLNRMIMLTHTLAPGFLNSHVRIETDMLGPRLDLVNEHMKPGENITIFIPAGKKTHTDIFIDHKLVKTIISDPWDMDHITGDILLWELLPLQFYQPISQN